MTRCGFRKASTNPKGEHDLPDACRMAHHMKRKGHGKDVIAGMAHDAELIRVWKKLLPPDVWESIRECEAHSAHECPFGKYYPEVEGRK